MMGIRTRQGSKIRTIRRMQYTGNVKFSPKLHDLIRDVGPCVVIVKSPSSPMKLWPFLCNVLPQFSQHWCVVHCCTSRHFHFGVCEKQERSTTWSSTTNLPAGKCCCLWILYMKPCSFQLFMVQTGNYQGSYRTNTVSVFVDQPSYKRNSFQWLHCIKILFIEGEYKTG